MLLDRGALINHADDDGETSLFVACYNGHIALAELLLDRGALINQANEGGRTPLLVACKVGHREIDFFRSYSDALPIVFYFCLIVCIINCALPTF